jgi:hypothetical protein
MLNELPLPRMFPVRQTFDRPRVADIPAAVAQELGRLFPAGSPKVRPGARIGITVGSRGIAGIDEISRAAVDFFKSRKARPFIIPAMGSHGGATPEGQKALLAHYGVTEEGMGCPIRAEMATISLGRAEGGVEAHLAQVAWESDGVLLLNRIKAHTDYKGTIESGLTKICAIGLGKLDGARECHGRLFDLGLGRAIRSVAEMVLATGKVLGGLAILENAYHETARLAGVVAAGLFESEEVLLLAAKAMGASLPFGELDLLICDRLGKNISGAGFDTNVIGRSVYGYVPGVPWMDGMPSIQRLFVRDLSDESDGNGVGMGMADFTTPRMLAKVNHAVTQLNCFTSRAPFAGRSPLVLPNDREAVATALSTCRRRPDGPLVTHIQDTLHLHDLFLSEALLPAARLSPRLEVLGEPQPMKFDGEGWMEDPFELERS